MKLKRLLLVWSCILVGLANYAQSGLIILSESGEPFSVGINSWLQTPTNITSVYINKIDTPIIKLDVVLENDSIPNLTKKINLNKSSTLVYAITKTSIGTYKIRYRGNIEHNPEYKKSLIAIQYSKEKKIVLPQKLILVAKAEKPDTIPVKVEPIDTVVVAITEEKTIEKPDSITKTVKKDTVVIKKIDATKLAEELKSIEFEFEKLLKAKVIVENNALTTADIIVLTEQLKFDNTKVLFLKHAYDFVVDKENFMTTLEQLQFETIKEELENYIKSKSE